MVFRAAIAYILMMPLYAISQDNIILARKLILFNSRLAPSGPEKLQIPRKIDPTADARLIQSAIELEAIDQKLLGQREEETFSKVQLEAFATTRNAAIDNLIHGRNILTGTAGGEFPRTIQSAVSDMLMGIKLGLKEPKGRDTVITEITHQASVETPFPIEYQTYAEFSAKLDQWSTYQLSQAMAVDTYNFRVTSLAGGKQCSELIAIMSHPTKKAICGRLTK
jgi:hypothetical protein